MKLKEIWTFIKTVLWPAAKPFICASREEAIELRDWVEAHKPLRSLESEIEGLPEMLPEFYLRVKEALSSEETPRQNDPAPAPKPKINCFGVWPSDWWKD